jgi:bifunctional DNase/RNase
MDGAGMDGAPQAKMIEMVLSRIVLRDADRGQYIFLLERNGKRGFPMVIGRIEAEEMHRVVAKQDSARPMTHQLAHSIVEALGGTVRRADIVNLRENTFFAQLVIQTPDGATTALLDARPSDAIALALRARAPIRVAEFVLEQVRSDRGGPDPLPDEGAPGGAGT